MAPKRTADQIPFTGDFPLRKVANLLPSYASPPAGSFDPFGSWEQSYAMYVLTGSPLQLGRFAMKRTPKGPLGFELDMVIQRRAESGFSHFQQAKMQCRSNILASPTTWTFETKMAKAATEKAYLQSGRTRDGAVADGTLVVREGSRVHKTPLAPEYSNEWSLMEAVQRLRGDQFKPLSYTLIDEYDAPQPGHTLSYRGKQQVDCQGGKLNLTGYQDIGQAAVPTTYWVDEHNRLVFLCAGLQVYVLLATNGQSVPLPPHYSAYSSAQHNDASQN